VAPHASPSIRPTGRSHVQTHRRRHNEGQRQQPFNGTNHRIASDRLELTALPNFGGVYNGSTRHVGRQHRGKGASFTWQGSDPQLLVNLATGGSDSNKPNAATILSALFYPTHRASSDGQGGRRVATYRLSIGTSSVVRHHTVDRHS
jgi:hypothetical protein